MRWGGWLSSSRGGSFGSAHKVVPTSKCVSLYQKMWKIRAGYELVSTLRRGIKVFAYLALPAFRRKVPSVNRAAVPLHRALPARKKKLCPDWLGSRSCCCCCTTLLHTYGKLHTVFYVFLPFPPLLRTRVTPPPPLPLVICGS